MGFPKKNGCPLLQSECKEHACRWYVHTVGINPQTEAQIDQFGCAIEFIPLLLIENSQQQRQTGAAVESFRNETLRANQIPFLLGMLKRPEDKESNGTQKTITAAPE